MPDDTLKEALEHELRGYEQRLAGAREAKDKDLAARMEDRISAVRSQMGKRETTARTPGERAVAPKAEKRG